MFEHEFLFSTGIWIGEGRVSFSTSPEFLHFYTRWMVEKEENGVIRCSQEVEMRGIEEIVRNIFVFSHFNDNHFNLELTNALFGEVAGKGIIDNKTIAWEFRGQQTFEGFEVYEKQENGDYMLHAEYSSPDQLRTIVDGRIWKKLPS